MAAATPPTTCVDRWPWQLLRLLGLIRQHCLLISMARGKGPRQWNGRRGPAGGLCRHGASVGVLHSGEVFLKGRAAGCNPIGGPSGLLMSRSEEHTSELQSRFDLVCRLLLEKKKKI